MLQHPSTLFAQAKEGPRHHYIPVFYLKQWTGGDGRLCEYSRPHKEAKALRKAPKATGFARCLYNLPGVPRENADIVERHFFSPSDDWAARAHQILLASRDSLDFPDARTKAGWAQFVYSLILRSPETIVRLQERYAETAMKRLDDAREKYARLRQTGDPETYEEFRVAFLANPLSMSVRRILHNMISNKEVIEKILSMNWYVVHFDNVPFSLLTSDRPVVMTNGFVQENAHIAIPISPACLFLAVNSERLAREFRSLKPPELIQRVNNKVCECAVKYVYGVDDRQLRFVSNRLGRAVPSSPLG